jgi:hypothetical protein
MTIRLRRRSLRHQCFEHPYLCEVHCAAIDLGLFGNRARQCRSDVRLARRIGPAARGERSVAPLSVLIDCISFLLGSGLLRFALVRERQYRERSPLSKPLVKAPIETFDQFADDLEPSPSLNP